jgi:FixJ family two-component response regulator
LNLQADAPSINLADAKIALISGGSNTSEGLLQRITSRGPTVRQFNDIDAWLASVSTSDSPESETSDDCLILHGPLDDEATLAAIAKIRQRRLAVPVVVLSPRTTIQTAVAAMRHGASNVVETGASDTELWDALQDALRVGVHKRTNRQYVLQLQKRLATLSDGEHAVLGLLLQGHANKDIAQALRIGLRTAELRRSRIMKKMESRSLAELVRMTCEARSGAVLPQSK